MLSAVTASPAELALPLRAGDVLGGKYRIEQVLGEGGMGVVYVGFHLELREHVAIKVLHPRRASDPEIVARFLREGRTAVKIRSEHVARILDVGTHDTGHLKLPYIVMELLEGQDLAHRIDSGGALPVPLAVDLVFQTCEALACAHALGIVHRDLKPSNLFLIEGPDAKPFVKVLDFGISKISDARSPDSSRAVTTTSDVLGSPGYMSPEQMRATRDVDARSDVWSLGMILWEMVVGKPMFGSATFPEICAKVLHGNLVPVRDTGVDVPEGLAPVIERALATEPDKRHPTVLALSEALAPFLEGDAGPRVARVANLSRPPSDRRSTMPSVPPPLAIGPTAPATPVNPPKATTAATPTPWGLTEASSGPAQKPTSRWPTMLLIAAVIGAAALVATILFRTKPPDPAPAAATATATVTATVTAAATVTATAVPTPTATTSASASATSRASVHPIPSAKPTVTATETASAKTPNGAPILR